MEGSARGDTAKWFADQLAMIQLCRSFGIAPRVVGGQGLGELVATCAAGVVSMDLAIEHIFRAGDSLLVVPVEQQPQCGIMCNATGELVRPGSNYTWSAAAARHVELQRGLAALHRHGCTQVVVLGSEIPADAEVLPLMEPGGWLSLPTLAKLYVAGATLTWSAIGSALGGRKVTLPKYPFQRRRYWPKQKNGMVSSATTKSPILPGRHPLLGDKLRSPVLSDLVYQSEITSTEPSFVADHRLFGTSVLPATAYLELALAAAREFWGAKQTALEELRIHRPLLVNDNQQRLLQTILHPEGDTFQFQIVSLSPEPGAESWITHATGTILAATLFEQLMPVPFPSNGEQSSCDGPEYYQNVAAAGFDFGPRFRGLTRVHVGTGRAAGEIQFPKEHEEELLRFRFHPGLLDACFQILGASLPVEQRSVAYMPVGLERFELIGQPTAELRSIATLRNYTAGYETLLVDFHIQNTRGEPVARATGLHLKLARRSALRPEGTEMSSQPVGHIVLPNLNLVSPTRGEQLLIDFVREHLSHVLDLEPQQAEDPRKPLSELGMDSFSAMELTDHLSQSTGLNLPTTLVYSHPNIQAIAQQLLLLLSPITGDEPTSDAASDHVWSQTLNEIENLSQEDLEAEIAKIVLDSPEAGNQR
jgi:acyl transferase domain-containing protein